MPPSFLPLTAADSLTGFDARTAALEDTRPHPTEAALVQLGCALMTELLDQVLGTALEDQATVIAEAMLGGLHVGVQRLDGAADRTRDRLSVLLREFDGSEVADVDLQDARRAAECEDIAAAALALVRDAAAQTYAVATGECWSPWRGGARPVRVTAAVIEASAALRSIAAARQAACHPQGPVVVFRGAPSAVSETDANRLFDALNWARGEWPDMALAITGAPGPERLARSWAMQKGVRLILARPDFGRHGRAAPFRANEDLIALEPICVLLLASPLDGPAAGRSFGPALNLAQLARDRGLRCVRVAARR